MSRFWLNYRRRKRGRLLGTVVLDSPSLVQARMSAAALRIDRGMPFADGRALGKATVELVPAAALGRMLSPQEARALQESLAGAARTLEADGLRKCMALEKAGQAGPVT